MTDFPKYRERGAYHFKLYEDGVDWYVKCVDAILDFVKGSTLDLGCGDGFIVYKLLEKGLTAYGMDSDPIGIKLANEKCKDLKGYSVITFNEVDIEQPLGAQADYMVCLNTIEHLREPRWIRGHFENNISKAGIIITDKAMPTPGKYHVHEFTLPELMKLFAEYDPEPFEIKTDDSDFIGVKIFKNNGRTTKG